MSVGTGTPLLLHPLLSTSLLLLCLSSAWGWSVCSGRSCRPAQVRGNPDEGSDPTQGFVNKAWLKSGQTCKRAHRPTYRTWV